MGTVEMRMKCSTRGILLLAADREETPGSVPQLLSAWLFWADSLISQSFSSGGTQRHKETQNQCSWFSTEVNLPNPLSQLCTPCPHIPSFARKGRQSSAHTKAPICSASEVSTHWPQGKDQMVAKEVRKRDIGEKCKVSAIYGMCVCVCARHKDKKDLWIVP